MNILTLCLLTLITSSFEYTSNVSLLKVMKNWEGHGVGHLIPGQMKILSNKIEKQVSLLTTYAKMPGGDNWQLDFLFQFDCPNSFATKSDEGIGFWISKFKPEVDNDNYTYENYGERFGMTPNVDGLMVQFYKDTIHTAVYTRDRLTRNEMIFNSKVCKIFPDEGK